MSCQGLDHDDRFGTLAAVLLFLCLLLLCFEFASYNDEQALQESERMVYPEESVAWRHLNSEAAPH